MKKILSLLLVFCMMTMSTVNVFAKSQTKLGDVNADGSTDNIDAMLVLQFTVGLIDETKIVVSAADVNGDDIANNIDAMLILRHAVGIEIEVDGKCIICGKIISENMHPKADYAEYFGISPNVQWIDDPKTETELINNILWNALNGDFDFSFIKDTSYNRTAKAKEVFGAIENACTVYSDIMGAYLNVITGGRAGKNFEVFYETNPLPLSEAEVYEQAFAALDQALEIKEELRANNAITENMSELEIVKVYYNYLQNYGVTAGGGPELQGTGKNMLYDTAYACLVDKAAGCGGRAAAFNLLMHVEGISAQGIQGQMRGTDSGHIISRVVADGQEYFVDWGNYKPIGNYEEASQWFDFTYRNNTSLQIARQAG